MDYTTRLKNLQSKLRRRKLDALLVSQPENRRYLCGYTAADHGISESSGVLFVPAHGAALLLTDFRYHVQAEQETSLKVECHTRGLIPLLGSLIAGQNIKRFGFESHYTLHSFSIKLAELSEKGKFKLVPAKGLIEKMRLLKDSQEIDLIRRSVQLNEQVFQQVYRSLDPQMSEIDTAMTIESAMRAAGAERPSFDTIVAAGLNSALPHAAPTSQELGINRPITIDMGLVLNGYCSDMTRTFVIGKTDEKFLEINRLVRRAQLAGMGAVKPGVSMKEVDQAARRIIADGGYGKNFGHSLGHGVGLAVHEGPRVSANSRQKLVPGMIITIEPGIYLPGWGGVRLENMIAIHEDGCELLNSDTTWLDI